MRTVLLIACFTVVLSAHAERLPSQRYTVADGLAGDTIHRIIRDRQGFLWFCTDGGFSRFDGRRFETYGSDLGADRGRVVDMVEDRDGVWWIAASDAVYRFDPAQGRDFESVLTEDGGWTDPVDDLLAASDDTIWAATRGGLFRLPARSGRRAFARVDSIAGGVPVHAISESRDGMIWVGAEDGLHGLAERDLHLTERHGLPHRVVRSLLEDRRGSLWVGTARGVCRLDAAPTPASTCTTPAALTEVRGWVSQLLEDRRGTLWILATTTGVAAWTPGTDAPSHPADAIGLEEEPRAFAEDGAGNIWVGTYGGGAVRIARGGLRAYGPEEGLRGPRIGALLETRAGDVIAVGSDYWIHRFDETGFRGFRPRFPDYINYLGWGWNQILVEEPDGSWWLPTGRGLCRFPAVGVIEELGRVLPERVYTREDGLGGNDVFRVFRDRAGDVWVGTHDEGRPMLTRRERGTGAFRTFGADAGLPADSVPSAFVEDDHGHLWIGFWRGELGRLRGGAFEPVPLPEGDAGGAVNDLYVDATGRLWVATSLNGALRIDDPGAERPTAERLDSVVLSSNDVRCITEDALGHLYLGTRRGVDRVDLETGRVRWYTMADGLPNSCVNVCFADRHGDLWFGTMNGVARLTPADHEPLSPPTVFVERLTVAGAPRALPGLVATSVPHFVVAPHERQIEIGFGGLEFTTGGFLRFQYRLADEAEWSEPTAQRSVLLAGLKPGAYHFAVRAINADGLASEEPATVTFTVLEPVWKRGWFLSLVGLALVSVVFAVHRVRLTRALALERQRTRIAMDLHDEVGSGLGSIGLLADMAAGDETDQAERRRLTEQIADVATELGTALGDIVGALRPGAATMESLAAQLAERGRRVFPGSEPALITVFPERWPRVSLSLAVRRNVFLIGAEALYNAARHAGATSVRLELVSERRRGRWRLAIADDGRGIDSQDGGQPGGGMGLGSMRCRAEEIDAELDVESSAGAGTEITLVFDPRAGDRRSRGR